MCFCITFGSILAPFSHQSACFPVPFSSLFRSCSAKGALWAPFPLLAPLWSPFGIHLAPIWDPFALFCLPFGRLWHAGAPFGSAGAPFGIPLASVVSLLSLSSLNSPFFFPRFPSSSAYVPNIYLMRGKPRSRHRFESRILVAYGGNRYENFKSYPMSYVPWS